MTVGIADTSDTDMLPAANTKASSRGEFASGHRKRHGFCFHAGLWAAINNSSMDPINKDAVSLITA
jgi:glucose/arabinose dehydrogenase